MKYIAARKPGRVTLLTLFLYVVGVVLFILPSYLSFAYGAFCQLGGIAFIAFAIQFTIRYMLTDYTYEIYDYASAKSRYPLLNIYRTQGQRSTLIAAVGFDDMVSIEKKPKIEGGVTLAANYCPAFRAKDVYCVTVSDGGKQKLVYLECDEAFAARIAERIALYGVDHATIVPHDTNEN